ncbi:TonB C-terminal domain-containing protein [Myxococcaceae bacterium GXIMD 01537]
MVGRVQGMAVDELARLRVDNGVVHPYFGKMRAALEKQLENAPLFGTPSTLQHMARNWRDQAQRYGASGAPGGVPPPPMPSANERVDSIARNEPHYDAMRARLQAGEELQDIADGKRGARLLILIELEQGPDGALRSAKVVRGSGNAAFDEYVMARVPTALAPLAPPPAQAAGVRADGIHTLWEVEGRVIYLRKLSEMKGQDLWYTSAMAAAGVLAGKFDETTGDVEVIDLRNPRFVCKPRLLRVY